MRQDRLIALLSLLLLGVTLLAWARSSSASEPKGELPKPATDLPAPADGETSRTAIFAGGCFWCTEVVFEYLEGVTDVTSGYAGGTKDTADYKRVSNGRTEHAEAIQITYDPRKVSFADLLHVFFFSIDPTALNYQGPDHGRQYRSVVFYENEDQKRVAEAYIKQLTDAKIYDKPIAVTVDPIGEGFFPAEDYHQDYVKHNPDAGYVKQWALPKLDKLKKAFGEKLKEK